VYFLVINIVTRTKETVEKGGLKFCGTVHCINQNFKGKKMVTQEKITVISVHNTQKLIRLVAKLFLLLKKQQQ